MTKHRGPPTVVGVARCSTCPDIHLIISEGGDIVCSIPLDREQWSQLIGVYGDLAAAGMYNSERKH